MAGASGGLLAAHVTAAGGFGFLAAGTIAHLTPSHPCKDPPDLGSAGYKTAADLLHEISLARGALQPTPSDPLPIGVGYLCWQLEQPTAKPEVMLSAALDSHVQAIWLAFGNKIQEWIKFIRNYDAAHNRIRKTTIFVQVSSVQDALVALNDWKVDVLVAQGNESGGHGYGCAPPLFTLVSSILAVWPRDGPPLLAAGGVVTGSQIASLLVLGAAGAVLGTRFLLTPESLYNDAQKKALVAAKSDATVRTMAFDRARGTLDWPEGVDGRALYNSTVKDVDSGVDIGIVKDKFREGTRIGESDRMLVWSGLGIGLISEIKAAKEVVQELDNDIVRQLNLAAELVR
ncbi:Nitronate monooxygenase-domain-containing protein [Chiua virens]|nr:Nitronate monooxygenase-domain-containing protein [Chiua virens]